MGKHDEDKQCRCNAYPVPHNPKHEWLPAPSLKPVRPSK